MLFTSLVQAGVANKLFNVLKANPIVLPGFDVMLARSAGWDCGKFIVVGSHHGVQVIASRDVVERALAGAVVEVDRLAEKLFPVLKQAAPLAESIYSNNNHVHVRERMGLGLAASRIMPAEGRRIRPEVFLSSKVHETVLVRKILLLQEALRVGLRWLGQTRNPLDHYQLGDFPDEDASAEATRFDLHVRYFLLAFDKRVVEQIPLDYLRYDITIHMHDERFANVVFQDFALRQTNSLQDLFARSGDGTPPDQALFFEWLSSR